MKLVTMEVVQWCALTNEREFPVPRLWGSGPSA